MRESIVKILTVLTGIITAFQLLVPQMPFQNEETTVFVSAVLMFAVSVLTASKQYFSCDVSNKALKSTLIIALIATVGAFNELINALTIPEVLGQWLRFFITAATAILNFLSKEIFPSKEYTKEQSK